MVGGLDAIGTVELLVVNALQHKRDEGNDRQDHQTRPNAERAPAPAEDGLRLLRLTSHGQ